MNHLLLALRNLARNRRRTAIALSVVGFGVMALLLAGGFVEWIFWAMRTDMIESQFGHIQVVRPGYLEAGAAEPFGYLLPEQSTELNELQRLPGVKFIAPRLAFNGLISFGEHTVSFVGEGIDPVLEAPIGKRLALTITSGTGLSGPKAQEVILGRGLAKNVGAEAGDTVILLVNTANGSVNAMEARVAGLFRTYAKAYDDAALRAPIALARRLLRASGAHTWVVRLEETELTKDVLAEFKAKYPEARSDLQFVPWYSLADFYNKTVALFSRQIGAVRLIIALIIVLSISNILVMSVLERTGEIGTLFAIGHRPRSVMTLFFSEGLLLGIAGGGIGLLAGLVLAQMISALGIPMPPPPGADEGFTGEVLVTWPLAIGSFALAVVTTSLSALYPAWKASRLNIVDALRHNR